MSFPILTSFEMPILLYTSILIIAGLIMAALVKRFKLPSVTGYLIAGLIISPFSFGIIPEEVVHSLEVISEAALGFIAFGIGGEFKLSYIKKMGKSPAIIAFFEAFTASLVVAIVVYMMGFGISLALLLGAIAAATAPAATIMVVNQYKAKGPLTSTLLSVVALDDAVALMLFGFASATVKLINSPESSSFLMAIITPLFEIILSILVGAIFALIMRYALKICAGRGNKLNIAVAFIFLSVAVSEIFELSALLMCMSIGCVMINICADSHEMFEAVESVTPPIYLLFFVISGAELDLTVLPTIGVIGIAYIIARVVGKVAGASFGATIAKAPKAVSKYVGFTLVPQAGVAIGLSMIAAAELPEYANTITAVILTATFIYELTGPVITKKALIAAGEITAID